MKPHLRLALWAGIAAPSIVIAASGAGCSSISVVPIGSSSVAQTACPATLAETIGAACAVFGSTCGPTITCGFSQISVLCLCDGHAFQCTDGAGNPVDTADAATCLTPLDASTACPHTETAAEFAPCQSTGLVCNYPSSCPNAYDQCQCFPGQTRDGGFGFRFECEPAACESPDASVGSPTPTSETDASESADTVSPEASSSDEASDAQGNSEAEAAASAADSSLDAAAASDRAGVGDAALDSDSPAE
ncbi:MAG: hypothetical protein WBY94_27315 [Polyangiaceae bacterium]